MFLKIDQLQVLSKHLKIAQMKKSILAVCTAFGFNALVAQTNNPADISNPAIPSVQITPNTQSPAGLGVPSPGLNLQPGIQATPGNVSPSLNATPGVQSPMGSAIPASDLNLQPAIQIAPVNTSPGISTTPGIQNPAGDNSPGSNATPWIQNSNGSNTPGINSGTPNSTFPQSVPPKKY